MHLDEEFKRSKEKKMLFRRKPEGEKNRSLYKNYYMLSVSQWKYTVSMNE